MDRSHAWHAVNRPDDAAAADPALADCFAAPRLPDGFVRRPRLIRLAAGALSRPLLLITGPAGAGKSLLAAEWSAAAATRRAGLVAWYTAEPGDDAPGVFWPRLLEALRQAGLDVPADPAAAAPSGAVTSSAARLAAFLTASPRPVILIIDQFERAGGRDVAAGLDFLLAHAAARLRLVLISRSEPLLALHRYRASGEIAEIRAADLAFRLEEAARLLRREGLCVPDDAVRALWRRTEGWAAGLRLSALAAKHADDPEVYIKEFEAGEAAVADFVLAEVLATQPAEVQDLLLRTSIVERTHVGLADALTGRHDAARILEDLAHENAFVELIGHRWYRSHRLFAEILRHRLRARDPVLEADLHRRAARWLGEHDLLGDALAHWAAAGDWDLAADRLVAEPAIGRLLVGLDAERLRRLFAGMPREASGTGPELVRAGLALARQDAERAVVHLDRAAPRPSPSAAGTDAPAPGVELTQAVLRVLAAALTGCADDAQHRAADADALECQTPDAAGAGHPELPRLVHAALGSACLWEGRFDAARTAFLRAIDLCADAADAAATRQDARGRLALIDQLRGTLGRAQARAGDVLADAARGGAPPTSGTAVAHLVLARAAFERDELDASRAGLEHAAEAAPDEHDPIVRAGSAVLRARLLLAEGDPAAALDALAPAIRPPGRGSSTAHPSPWAAPEAAEAAAEAHLALGDAPAARDAASREASHDPACAVALARAQLAVEQDGEAARATLESTGPLASSPPPVAVRALLVGACVARQAGDEPAAMRRLAQALDVARPDRLCRPFRETLPWVAHALRTHPTLSRGHTWLPHDLRAAPQPEPVPGAALVEPLSGREREVLERAAQMMSTTEIADDLWLSVNTVKTHLKNINRKLCTTRRAEAVRRARDLRML